MPGAVLAPGELQTRHRDPASTSFRVTLFIEISPHFRTSASGSSYNVPIPNAFQIGNYTPRIQLSNPNLLHPFSRIQTVHGSPQPASRSPTPNRRVPRSSSSSSASLSSCWPPSSSCAHTRQPLPPGKSCQCPLAHSRTLALGDAMANRYGEAALLAVRMDTHGKTLTSQQRWEEAVRKLYPTTPAGQKKSAPRHAFLGLCEAGLVQGIHGDAFRCRRQLLFKPQQDLRRRSHSSPPAPAPIRPSPNSGPPLQKGKISSMLHRWMSSSPSGRTTSSSLDHGCLPIYR